MCCFLKILMYLSMLPPIRYFSGKVFIPKLMFAYFFIIVILVFDKKILCLTQFLQHSYLHKKNLYQIYYDFFSLCVWREGGGERLMQFLFIWDACTLEVPQLLNLKNCMICNAAVPKLLGLQSPFQQEFLRWSP